VATARAKSDPAALLLGAIAAPSAEEPRRHPGAPAGGRASARHRGLLGAAGDPVRARALAPRLRPPGRAASGRVVGDRHGGGGLAHSGPAHEGPARACGATLAAVAGHPAAFGRSRAGAARVPRLWASATGPCRRTPSRRLCAGWAFGP
jgi:hypothetical protein